MPNGSPPPTGALSAPLPGWLQPLVTITTQVGVPTVFAMVLLWFVLTRLDTALKVIEGQEEQRTAIIKGIGADFTTAIEKQAVRFEAAIQQNIAVNRELAERYHGPLAPRKEYGQ